MHVNPLLLTDSYKYTHAPQYPPRTTSIYSYFESRGGLFKDTVFFQLQYLLKEYLSQRITIHDIVEARELCRDHFGNPNLFNEHGFMALLHKHSGRWPVIIKAVPEGAVIPTHNVLMTVENTDPELPWVTNFLETLLVQVWYGTTVATLSREMKKIINAALEKTGDPALIDFKLHDFGCRGVSSMESAAIGGMAHLVNFKGTDTVPGLMGARKYYGEAMAGFSIPAAEHSTITSWGRTGEVDAYRNMLTRYPKGLVAVVSDSWSIHDACSAIWGGVLRETVLAREGTVVIRPDSGTPHKVVPEVLDIIGAKFGFHVNDKFFKVLNPKVRVIQGDGIDYEETKRILGAMIERGWSADNIAFGMGGGLLQKVNRDTQNFAFKCSSATVDGSTVDVYKQPATQSMKHSKKGRLKLVRFGDAWTTWSNSTPNLPHAWDAVDDSLVEVFRDGELKVDYSFESVRKRAAL
jgi:nicotinamide phosphoribosyltransferase